MASQLVMYCSLLEVRNPASRNKRSIIFATAMRGSKREYSRHFRETEGLLAIREAFLEQGKPKTSNRASRALPLFPSYIYKHRLPYKTASVQVKRYFTKAARVTTTTLQWLLGFLETTTRLRRMHRLRWLRVLEVGMNALRSCSSSNSNSLWQRLIIRQDLLLRMSTVQQPMYLIARKLPLLLVMPLPRLPLLLLPLPLPLLPLLVVLRGTRARQLPVLLLMRIENRF